MNGFWVMWMSFVVKDFGYVTVFNPVVMAGGVGCQKDGSHRFYFLSF